MRQSKCLYVANAVFISPQGKVTPCGAIQNRKQLEVFESVEQLQTDPVFKDTKLYIYNTQEDNLFANARNC